MQCVRLENAVVDLTKKVLCAFLFCVTFHTVNHKNDTNFICAHV